MKKCFAILTILLLQSCITHYDMLEYYVDGYSPNSESLPMKGYFYQTSDSSYLDKWQNAVSDMYFFENGTYLKGSNHRSLDSLDKHICNFAEGYFKYDPFGFYTMKKDTILTEYISSDPMGDHQAKRYSFKAIQTKSGIKIIERNGKPSDEKWTFRKNECVPDSIKNWMIDHWKYRIK